MWCMRGEGLDVLSTRSRIQDGMEYRPGITYNLTRPGISNLFFLALLVDHDPTHAPSSSWVSYGARRLIGCTAPNAVQRSK